MSEKLFWTVMAASMTATVVMSALLLYVGIPAEAHPTGDNATETVNLYFDGDRMDVDIPNVAYDDNGYVRQIYSAVSSPRFAVSDSAIDSLMEVLDERMVGMSDLDKARALLDFVYINVYYKSDEYQFGYSEYTQHPSETLLNGKGDCEDMATLLYVLYQKAGLDAVMVYCNDHVAVAVDVDAVGESVSFMGRDYIVSDPTSSRGLGNNILEEVWFVSKAENPLAANVILLVIVAVQLLVGALIFTQWRGRHE